MQCSALCHSAVSFRSSLQCFALRALVTAEELSVCKVVCKGLQEGGFALNFQTNIVEHCTGGHCFCKKVVIVVVGKTNKG